MNEDIKSDLVDLHMYWHGETAKAIYVSDDGNHVSAVWLPKSKVEYVREGTHVTVTMPEWLAKDKELI
jgi:hypothetical protein